jgi:integrase
LRKSIHLSFTYYSLTKMPKYFELDQQITTKDHGEIVLYKRSDHKTPKWQVRIKIDGDKAYTRKSTKTTDIDKAKGFAKELYESLANKFQLTGSTKTKAFKNVVDEWLDLQHQQHKNPATIQEFKDRLYNYPVRLWGNQSIDTLQQADLSHFIDWRKTQGRTKKAPANTTIKKDLVPLRQVFEYAYGKKYINQRLKFPIIKIKHNRRSAFTDTEWMRIIKKLPEWVDKSAGHRRHYRDRFYLKQYFLIMGYSGIRPGSESRSLKWSSLAKEHLYPHKDKKVTIQVRKGKRGPRKLTPDVKVEGYLLELKVFRTAELALKKMILSEDEPIFCHENGRAIRSFKKGFTAFLEHYSLLKDYDGSVRSPYSLRHTYATRMISQGVNHWDLAKNMGTSVDQLEKYYVHDNLALYGGRIAEYVMPKRPKSNLPPISSAAKNKPLTSK